MWLVSRMLVLYVTSPVGFIVRHPLEVESMSGSGSWLRLGLRLGLRPRLGYDLRALPEAVGELWAEARGRAKREMGAVGLVGTSCRRTSMEAPRSLYLEAGDRRQTGRQEGR
jgi:hypothetical protein